MSAEFQPPNLRKGLAIASLVLGIVSIPTLGLLVVGGVTGIILGAVALSKIKNNPQVYGGRGLAIAGIITSAVSLVLICVFGILGAIAVPRVTDALKIGRETAAVKSLLSIHSYQMQYNKTKGHCGTLQELAEANLLDKAYLNNAVVNGYVYTESEVSTNSYCVHATRTSNSAARRDFIVCEDGNIRYVESTTKRTVRRGEGKLLGGSDPTAPEALPTTTP